MGCKIPRSSTADHPEKGDWLAHRTPTGLPVSSGEDRRIRQTLMSICPVRHHRVPASTPEVNFFIPKFLVSGKDDPSLIIPYVYDLQQCKRKVNTNSKTSNGHDLRSAEEPNRKTGNS